MKTITAADDLSILDIVTSPQFEFVNNEVFLRRHEWTAVPIIGKETGEFRSDPSRASARFVVLSLPVFPGDGCTSYGPNFPYVSAQRLNDDGKFNPEGEIILFSLGKQRADLREITVVGRMGLVQESEG
jgi:hypothetical protein